MQKTIWWFHCTTCPNMNHFPGLSPMDLHTVTLPISCFLSVETQRREKIIDSRLTDRRDREPSRTVLLTLWVFGAQIPKFWTSVDTLLRHWPFHLSMICIVHSSFIGLSVSWTGIHNASFFYTLSIFGNLGWNQQGSKCVDIEGEASTNPLACFFRQGKNKIPLFIVDEYIHHRKQRAGRRSTGI